MSRNIYKLRGLHLNQLIELSQIGDKEALGIILEKFEPMVKSIVSKYYGTWVEFEDFLQIGFVGLIQAVYNFREDANTKFSSFAYMNISSEVKSFVTYLNRNKHKVLTDAISIEKTDDDFSENADYYFEDVDSEKEDFLMEYFFSKSMDELQEEEKELVKLWMSGYTYQEISDISNVNTKKVDNTLQKIKKILEGKKSEYEQIKDIFGGSI
ncbi:MAG: sigma-70 family RNA polymerase sigma factor [Defluviitoga tunisiensis]|jgi:RNA polymerase sporulation-specific sigma factor|nr:sigma-70 family RNA polymerase sigma factor [Defluviitoga tunisiensis]MDY0378926.1 sigma-70 family RNA polymerase sigma factor [Defluviitoga tunisiensis]HHV01584.1 sigma-70 family RNA polymerase sigma factor [Defluviitoga tunisiensis]HOB55464.1 sigma-70 family RNA polymerase sigma factor [Defluviitoga tunisiensis]HOK17006.1 sigma-70 family RNA polymerase sigma factor [Defluviitoga tunisiensis]